MVKRLLIAGNWKMNLDKDEAVRLVRNLVDGLETPTAADVIICPPSVYLDVVGDALRDSSIVLGAQNMYHEASGAFTGEVGTAMLADLGCKYVILGHSERRHVLGEQDELIRLKVLAALTASDPLVPILCVGETLAEREAGDTGEVIRRQFEGSCKGLSSAQMQRVVIAYEPVWAIGTGQVATPEQAEEVHADLRSLIRKRYNQEVAEAIRIQYGGSVKPDNARVLLSQPNIDGALVGGASLQAESFLAIVTANP
ncbi:MAG: triose-phosphate isomerase [Planctomycetaceae bacterium]|nr:triose-phosphate isomerase [Planctomycetaceae bacterium]MBP61416.1 triose-phosphate isomerase [Planctomycetaceae bacterium]